MTSASSEPESAGSSTLPISVQRTDRDQIGARLIKVSGEADAGTAPQLRDELVAVMSVEPGTWTIDLQGLSFCDLKGLDALRDAERMVAQAGCTVGWQGASPRLLWLAERFPERVRIPAMRDGHRRRSP